MKYFFVIILLWSNAVYSTQTPPLPAIEPLKNPLPSLGTCDQYTDYYIYQCIPFKCELEIANHQNVYREMEIVGFKDDKCIHNINLRVRHSSFPNADFHIFCNLSKEGRVEMADLFTRYKKGDLSVYQQTVMSKELKKECNS